MRVIKMQLKQPLTDRQKSTMVEELLHSVDFEKIHSIMVLTNHVWYPSLEVPTINQIRSLSRDLLIQALNKQTTIRQGGLNAKYNPESFELTLHYEVGFKFTNALNYEER